MSSLDVSGGDLYIAGGGGLVHGSGIERHDVAVGVGHGRCFGIDLWGAGSDVIQPIGKSNWACKGNSYQGQKSDECELHDGGCGFS